MKDLTNWSYYYNREGAELVRANLVYTPRVSPDGKIFCMDFTRDIRYHKNAEENALWNDAELAKRFNTEIEFHNKAKAFLPVLEILDIDYTNRRVFIEWHGDDFHMQGMNAGGCEHVLANWQEQWFDIMRKMWRMNIAKISLHPNSFVAKDGVLIPFNWFFCYSADHAPIHLRSLLIQISKPRQEKLASVLASQGLDLDTLYSISKIQSIALNSFRANYPKELIDQALTLKDEIL